MNEHEWAIIESLSDEDFLKYFNAKSDSFLEVSKWQLKALYGRFYHAYKKNPRLSSIVDYEDGLRDLFLAVNDVWMQDAGIESYRTQCYFLLRRLYGEKITYQMVVNHVRHLCYDESVDPDYDVLAIEMGFMLIDWLTFKEKEQKEMIGIIDNLMRSQWSLVWCRHGLIFPDYVPIDYIFTIDKSPLFYQNLQKIMTGSKQTLTDEDAALLLAVEVGGLASIHPQQNAVDEISVLHF